MGVTDIKERGKERLHETRRTSASSLIQTYESYARATCWNWHGEEGCHDWHQMMKTTCSFPPVGFISEGSILLVINNSSVSIEMPYMGSESWCHRSCECSINGNFLKGRHNPSTTLELGAIHKLYCCRKCTMGEAAFEDQISHELWGSHTNRKKMGRERCCTIQGNIPAPPFTTPAHSQCTHHGVLLRLIPKLGFIQSVKCVMPDLSMSFSLILYPKS